MSTCNRLDLGALGYSYRGDFWHKSIFNPCTANEHNILDFMAVLWTRSDSVPRPVPREPTQALYLQPKNDRQSWRSSSDRKFLSIFCFGYVGRRNRGRLTGGTDWGSGRKQVCELAGPGRLFGGARSAPSGAVHALEHGRRRWEARRRRGTGLAVFLELDWRCSKVITAECMHLENFADASVWGLGFFRRSYRMRRSFFVPFVEGVCMR